MRADQTGGDLRPRRELQRRDPPRGEGVRGRAFRSWANYGLSGRSEITYAAIQMRQIIETIPDVNAFLALEPEELASKVLFLLGPTAGMFHPGNIKGEIWSQNIGRLPPPEWQRRENEVNLAIAEAFAWLEAQALIVPAEGLNGQNGWRFLSRRARSFRSEEDFQSFVAARRLQKDVLHPKISNVVWQEFIRGQYDVGRGLGARRVRAFRKGDRYEPHAESV